jgi:Ni/Fe-hydrogenase 1 B-type cytochrome subunit
MTTTAVVFDRLYIWERPVRLYHWATALSLLVLVATGLVIGRPPAFLTAADASASTWFGTVRLVHFVAAFVFTFVFVVRVYWLFAGNRYAHWQNFFPLTPTLFRDELRQAGQVVKVDLLQIQKEPLEVKGHNALAAWSYTAVFAVTVFEVITGFALYAPMSGWWLPQLFVWVSPLMGGDAAVRFWHHAATWFFVVFTAVHVYLCIYHDYVEGHGEISSMISGSKFVPRGER